jgi:hypothetical protein
MVVFGAVEWIVQFLTARAQILDDSVDIGVPTISTLLAANGSAGAISLDTVAVLLEPVI